MNRSNIRARSGFTLIELLVVIAIIAILAAILFPVFAQAKAAAKKAVAISNVKQIDLGSIMYSNDYDDQYVPYFSYLNPATYATGAPSEYWPGLLSTYVQKSQEGVTGAGGQQILAQDLSKIFFDPIENFTFPTSGAYGNIASWGISDDIVNWWEPAGVNTTFVPVNGSTVVGPANTIEFAETWDWLNAYTTNPGYPGSALLLSMFDNNGPQPYNPNYTHDGQPAPRNGALETLQATYNEQYQVTGQAGNAFNPFYVQRVNKADPAGQNCVGFCDGHVKSLNVGRLDTDTSLWSISGTGQWP